MNNPKEFIRAIKWAAYNDDSSNLNFESIKQTVIVGLISFIFDKSIEFIADLILSYRKGKHEE